ncbi:hypothetical protein ONZ45_g16607 [Pleurotus djamor]|nr:hypothetical protein ONZ45_g16607 [Pleurotus djamor]
MLKSLPSVNIDHQESTHHLGKIGEGMINAPYDEDLCFAIQVHYKPTYESFLRNRIEDFRSRVPRIPATVSRRQPTRIHHPYHHHKRLELAAEFDEADADDLYTIAASFEHNGLGRRSLAVGDELRDMLPYKEYYQYRCLYNLPTPPKDWGILINATKKQFINASTIGVDLQTMIMPLIIWAGEDIKRFGINNQGPWAGDRIAIISEEDFATRVAEDGPSAWLDIIDKGLELQKQWIEAFGVRDLDMNLPY